MLDCIIVGSGLAGISAALADITRREPDFTLPNGQNFMF